MSVEIRIRWTQEPVGWSPDATATGPLWYEQSLESFCFTNGAGPEGDPPVSAIAVASNVRVNGILVRSLLLEVGEK